VVKEMKGEKGFTLIEVVIAIGILGIIAAAFMAALAGASRALFIADERATAESLARSQMEYVKSQPYSNNVTYLKLASANIPAGYDISFVTANVTGTTGLQKIDVTVKHLTNNKLVITLEGYKGDR
jgi:prepilin-type N-terminal cleavage/methylation domain-containing protein